MLDQAGEPDRHDEEQPDREQRPRPRPSPPNAPPEISCSSSGSCALAEMLSARSPIAERLRQRDDAADHRQPVDARRRLAHGTQRERLDSIAPSASGPSSSGAGLRTATAHVGRRASSRPRARPGRRRARRATRSAAPRRRAARSLTGLRALGAGACARAPALGDAALEALDAAAGVDQLLAARVERMAGRADLDVDLGLASSGS